MLESIDSRHYPIVYRILIWIAMSRVSFSPAMLAEAAIIDPRAEPPFDPQTKLKGLEKPKGLLKLLPGLLREEDDCAKYGEGPGIKFSHFSVQEFLFSTNLRENPSENVSRYALHRDEANNVMAESCICYHLYASQVKDVTEGNQLKLFPLWEYAALNWTKHLEAIDEKLWTPLLKKKVLFALKPDTDSFICMIRFSHPTMTTASFPPPLTNRNPYSAYPAYYMSANGCQRVLSLYLKDLDTEQLNAQINCQLIEAPESFGNPLQAAAYNRDHETIKLLLEWGADVNAQGGWYGNALQAAAYGRSEETVKLLLDYGADVNAQGGEYGNALQAAACRRQKKIVKLLLEHGADISAQGGVYGNALQAAAYAGHRKIVKHLQEHGADVNAQGGWYGNALQAAASRGSTDIVELLLELGADINAKGGMFGNALQAAAAIPYSGLEDVIIIKLLIKHGADVNAQGGFYGSALKAASKPEFQGKPIIDLLLLHGARE